MSASVRVGIVLAILCVCVAAVVAQNKDEEFRRLQGGWQVVAAEQRGKPFDVIRGGALVITDTHFFLKTAAGNNDRGQYQVNQRVYKHDWVADIDRVDEGGIGDPRQMLRISKSWAHLTGRR